MGGRVHKVLTTNVGPLFLSKRRKIYGPRKTGGKIRQGVKPKCQVSNLNTSILDYICIILVRLCQPVYQYNQVNKTKNRLYVFGTAFHGGIGLQNLIKPKDPSEKTHLFMWKPVRHKFAEFHELTEMVAGHGFSLFAIKPRVPNGPFIFGCGKNHASQLGLWGILLFCTSEEFAMGFNLTHLHPLCFTGYQATRTDGPMETLLSIVPLPFTGKNSSVLALGAGRAHSLVSVQGEGLFTLGDNSAGQCGRKVIENEGYFGSKYIHKFSRFKEDDVVSIASKFDIS